MITDKILGSSITIPFETKSGGVLTAPVSATALVMVNVADESERTTNVTPTFNRGSVNGVHKAVIDTNHAFYVANGVYELRFIDGTLDGVPLADMVIETISFGAATSANTSLSSLTSTASDHTDKINSIKAATDANLTGNAFTRLGAPVGASLSADIAATKAAAEAAETAAEEGINISEIDRAAIAAKVNAARSTFYPVRSRVWKLQRDAEDGIVVADSVVLSKQAGETAKVWIDFAALVGRGEAVEAFETPTITGSTFAITTDSEELTVNLLGFVVTGGAAGATGTVSFEVTTTADQVLTGTVQITVPE